MGNKQKRVISLCIFGAGAAIGLPGCLRVAGAIFVIGENDSLPEVCALLLPITFSPVCISALWWRKASSFWLAFLGVLWIFGIVWQRHYMTTVRHFQPGGFAELLAGMIPAFIVLSFALSGLLTDRAGWPKLLRTRAEH